MWRCEAWEETMMWRWWWWWEMWDLIDLSPMMLWHNTIPHSQQTILDPKQSHSSCASVGCVVERREEGSPVHKYRTIFSIPDRWASQSPTRIIKSSHWPKRGTVYLRKQSTSIFDIIICHSGLYRGTSSSVLQILSIILASILHRWLSAHLRAKRYECVSLVSMVSTILWCHHTRYRLTTVRSKN